MEKKNPKQLSEDELDQATGGGDGHIPVESTDFDPDEPISLRRVRGIRSEDE